MNDNYQPNITHTTERTTDEFLRRVYHCMQHGLLTQDEFNRMMTVAMQTSYREGFTMGCEVQQLRS